MGSNKGWSRHPIELVDLNKDLTASSHLVFQLHWTSTLDRRDAR